MRVRAAPNMLHKAARARLSRNPRIIYTVVRRALLIHNSSVAAVVVVVSPRFVNEERGQANARYRDRFISA